MSCFFSYIISWLFPLFLVPPHPPILYHCFAPKLRVQTFSLATVIPHVILQSQGFKYHLYSNTKFLSPSCASHLYSRFVYPCLFHISTQMSNSELKLKNVKIYLPCKPPLMVYLTLINHNSTLPAAQTKKLGVMLYTIHLISKVSQFYLQNISRI